MSYWDNSDSAKLSSIDEKLVGFLGGRFGYDVIKLESLKENQETIIAQNKQIIDIGTQILNEIKRRNNIEEQKLKQQEGLTRR